MNDEPNVIVEIMIDNYSDGRPTVYAGVRLNDKIHTDADGPNIECALLQLIKNMGEQIIELDPFFAKEKSETNL